MLKNLLGDDEHTASEGPYSRLIKNRKWLLLWAVAATLYGHGQVRGEVIEKLLGGVIHVTHELLWFGVLIPLTVLTIQALLLIGQNVVTYDIQLGDRFEKIQSAKYQEIARALDEAISSRRETERVLAANIADAEAVESRLTDGQAVRRINVGTIAVQSPEELALRLKQLRSQQPSVRDQVAAFESRIEHYRRALAELSTVDPGRRPGFRAFEIAIDVARFGPALFAAAYAYWSLFT